MDKWRLVKLVAGHRVTFLDGIKYIGQGKDYPQNHKDQKTDNIDLLVTTNTTSRRPLLKESNT